MKGTKKSYGAKHLLLSAAEAVAVKTELMENSLDQIVSMASGMARLLKRGGTIFLAGNGGSAADCQHFATELVVRLTGKFERPSLPAIALTSDGALLTAAGNDYGFDLIFARQVESLVRPKDLLVLLSTSGNSANLVRAAQMAQKKKVAVYTLLGCGGGKLKRFASQAIIVPADSVQRIQEEHTFLIHSLVELIERELFG